MNEFSLVWSFRNRLSVFEESIRSADKTCPAEVPFYLVDAASDEETIRGLRNLCNDLSRPIKICESFYRSSLSEAWNLGMMLTDSRYVIFASSDTKFLSKGWYEALRSAMVDNGGEYILIENHSVFGVDKAAIPRLGWFDETYVIGPHFDVDYMIRASENGIAFGITPNQGYYHHGDSPETSQSRLAGDVENRLPMNDLTNEKLFKDKWETDWPGWEEAKASGKIHMPHPPTHISTVVRKTSEIDPHPFYTKKYE